MNKTRRELAGKVTKAAIGISASSYLRILGANSRIRLGVVGCGNRGRYLTQMFGKRNHVQIAACCDVYQQKVRSLGQEFPQAVQLSDYRRVIERKDIDAVLTATPDHWHAQIAIAAMNSGKDIYVEKPLTFRREEGALIIQAEQASGRICQVGLQRRSATLFRRAKQEIVNAGLLGKIALVRTVWHMGAPYDLGDPNEPQPTDLDWSGFLGQIPWRSWNAHQYHHYRLYLDYGGGCMTDLFTHWIDAVHMLLEQDGPQSVSAAGGIFIAKDDRTTPDTVNLVLEYPEFNVTFESTALEGMPSDHIVFYGSKGTLLIGRDRYEYRPRDQKAKPIRVITPETFVDEHIDNFLECCHSRKKPNCDARVGHRSALPCHLATMSYLQKRRIQFDPIREIFMS